MDNGFFNKDIWILIKIALKCVPLGPISNIPALVQIMAWRRSGDYYLNQWWSVYWRIYASIGLALLNVSKYLSWNYSHGEDSIVLELFPSSFCDTPNHRQLVCLFSSLFTLTKKTSKSRITGPQLGYPPRPAESDFISWSHHRQAWRHILCSFLIFSVFRLIIFTEGTFFVYTKNNILAITGT